MTAPQQLALTLDSATSYRSEDFVVAETNRLAYEWMMRWPHWPEKQFLLYGPKASGKTHLACLWAETAGAAPVVNFSTDALSPGLAYLLDADSDIDEQALFHVLNHVRAHEITLLLVRVGEGPAENITLPDLASRLNAMPQAALTPPDDELLSSLLIKYFADRQLRIGEEIVPYLLPRMERSFAGAAALVERIDREAMMQKRAVTVPFLRELLAENE